MTMESGANAQRKMFHSEIFSHAYIRVDVQAIRPNLKMG